MRHGGQILADQLRLHGVGRVFSVPGESFLAVLDGLHESGIRNVVCRQEGGAAMMAEAQGKMTGEPGICFVTRGPGATNAAAGVHVARQDSTPMILFIGQIDQGHRDREAFQEVDFRAMFGPLAKWAAEIETTERIPEYVARAFRVATSGRPGPVVLSLPEDVLNEEAEVPDRAPAGPTLGPDWSGAAREAMEVLRGAERPLVVVGGPHWSAEAGADLVRFAEAQGLPVAAGFRRQDYMDNRHPNYVGDLNVGVNPRLAKRLREADALLLLGTRLGDIETQGYTLLDPRGHGKRIVHVHPDADEPGRVWGTELAVAARAPDFVAALAQLNGAGGDWGEWVKGARADYEWWRTPQETPGTVKQEQVIAWLSANLPEDAILTNGAGNFAAFLHRYFTYKGYRTQLAPTSGSMGYGFPAAVAASLECPDRCVVCVAGDGDFQMTLNELSTAVQFGAKPVVIVMNNGRYGTIRMHQERTYPGRVSGTDLANPDYAALARAYGGYGEVVTRMEEFPHAFLRAREWGTVAILECRVDSEALTPSQTLSAARAQGMKARG
ncbi:Thiamine pyrophosphate-requiring enzyme [Rubellimicrobium mesophilum DSM 19309]|uniref:Thiamine pyrophosphate-requiring enzyme n=1 Tax=Rubellimicrobium mesophilum DSM 19309 TaxID=442562 RepID=A0A017HHZ0_9RHOB|nr:thiamine pyrophosphate-binding protein [Rubellimicrobium mesophilum]EYD73966.1 Thiamine pyrophosphate-requiring enzyme [Rubellimicrobium mesophilum DSM 19309]